MTTTSDLPEVVCPHCNETFLWDDDLEPYNTICCPQCGQTIYVAFLDITITATFSTERETL